MSVWPAPNVNPCVGTFEGRPAKMEVAPKLVLKAGAGAGAGTGTGTGSLLPFGKPKLKDGMPADRAGKGVGLLPSTDPKIFCSYSCNCWWTSAILDRHQVRVVESFMHTCTNTMIISKERISLKHF